MGNPKGTGREPEIDTLPRHVRLALRHEPSPRAQPLGGVSKAAPGVDAGKGSGPQGRITDSERLGYDAVNLPDHYRAFKLEPVRFCVENNLNFLQSSIIKYVVRFPLKNGIEDLYKAKRLLDMLIAFEEGDPDWWTTKSSQPGK